MWATPAIPKRRQAKTEPRMIFFVFFFMFLIIIIVIQSEVKNLECVKVDVYEIFRANPQQLVFLPSVV